MNVKRLLLLTASLGLTMGSAALAQTGQVGIGITTPNAKAALDITSTDKGLLIPRLTETQRTGMTSVPDGLMVFQVNGTLPGFWYYFGGQWNSIPNATTAGTVKSVTAGTGLTGGTITTTGTIAMPNVGTAGTYGSVTQVPQIVTDAQGRVSGVALQTIRPAVPACPVVGFADVTKTADATNSRLCVYHENFGNTWNNSAGDCYNFYGGAHLCRAEEIRRACVSGGFTLTAGSWLADRAGDDNAVYVNIADCNNFDGVAAVTSTQTGKYCCLEYMKF